MNLLRSKPLLLLIALALLSGAALWLVGERTTASNSPKPADLPALGLMTTLPIYWGEAGSIEEMLQTEGDPHWARTQLERSFRLVPLDTLDAEAGLAELDFLILAQPRALAPQENVALDDWVRAGGHLLLFADPLLTGESSFHIGDRRRPQDVALLSPILSRWGIELLFDDTQDSGERIVGDGGLELPVELAGSWAVVDDDARCVLEFEAVIASCSIGEGRVAAVADAAILELGHGGGAHPGALSTLLGRAFDSK